MCLVHRVGIAYCRKVDLHPTPLLGMCENLYTALFNPCYTTCPEEEMQEVLNE